MTDRFERLRELLLQALAIEPAARAAWLQDTCPDEALRAEVESLLALDTPDAPGVRTGAALPGGGNGAASLLARDRIGPWEILAVLAERDDAVLYRARGADRPARAVAVKVLRAAGAASPAGAPPAPAPPIVDPGVVLPFDAGATASGARYLAREFVRGVPVTDYADQVHLPLPDRLTLLLDAARSFAAAHRSGLAHGHVVPANVLVTRERGRAAVRIVDFGCRSAGPDAERDDVRAFGVLALELLTGARLPSLAAPPANGAPPPPLPSLLLDGPESADRARRRRTTPAAWGAFLRGDTDRAVARCLAGGDWAATVHGLAAAAAGSGAPGGVAGRIRGLLRRGPGSRPDTRG